MQTFLITSVIRNAVEKHDRFNEDVIKNKEKEFYCLLYSDKTKAEFLPGSDEWFNLKDTKKKSASQFKNCSIFMSLSEILFSSC